MKIRRPFLLAVLAASLMVPTSARCDQKPTGMSYLSIGVGADAVGMGEAVVSNVDGPGATYWNPGALGQMTGTQFGFVHNESFQSIRQEFAGVTRNFGRFGVGGSFHGTWLENIDSYDDAGNSLGHFAYYGVALGLSGAYKLSDTWSAGVTGQYLREAVDVYNASGMALDLGVQGREVLIQRLDAGLSVLHIGPEMKYVDQPFVLPTTIQGGVSYRLPLSQLGAEAVVAAEVRHVREQATSLLLGVEYRLQQAASLRVGYRSGLDTENVSFGIGFRHKQLQADYSYVPFKDDLGAQHRIGITIRR
jgi:hypothetical protein